LAIGVTVAYMAKANVFPLFETAMIRRGEYWRLVTSVLPHGGVMHLVFNVYWMWTLGTLIEETYGPFRTGLLVIVLAAGSGAFQFGLESGGIGLSGVVYGLFGLLWVLEGKDPRFSGVIDKRTVQVFVGWFFFCIVLTYFNFMAVGNIAHGSGAVLGVLIGFASVESEYRKLASLGSVSVFLFGLWCATLGRPYVNFSRGGGYEEGEWGYDALTNGRYEEAAHWFRDATIYRPKIAEFWYDLGMAEDRSNHPAESLAAYHKAADLDDAGAQIMIGEKYQFGQDGLPKDDMQAVAWYLKAAGEGSVEAQNRVAWLYATSTNPGVRNPVAALAYAQKAVAAEKEDADARILDTLAEAYYVNAKYSEAVKTEAQAIASADPDEKKDFEERMKKYEMAAQGSKKPAKGAPR